MIDIHNKLDFPNQVPPLAHRPQNQERIRVLEEQVKELQEKFNSLVNQHRELVEASGELTTIVVEHLFENSKEE